jgi:glycosyltransferase involved in cell wall biosynthesis
MKNEGREDVDFEIWLTLRDEEFSDFKSVHFLKNLGRLTPEEMNRTYNDIDALIFLSSMESYGLPLIEALTLSLPILVADFSYSKWVCEDSTYYFKPYNVKSFMYSLDQLIIDLRAKKKVNYTKVLKKFPNDWNTVAETFVSALRE